MKLLHWSLAAMVVSLCACTVAPSPTAPSATTTVDAMSALEGFEPAFFRALLQNGYEAPHLLEPIRMLRGPLRIYLRTRDESGRAVDRLTLDMTERTLIESAWIWSGHTFGVGQVERGVGTRENISGWLTVRWTVDAPANRCGRSTVGIDGGFIELNGSGACRCGLSTLVYPRLIRHELGHAMGYYHTDSADDVMYGHSITSSSCNLLPSDRERRHAKFAHSGRH